MSATIVRRHVARKRHQCRTCSALIEPGDEYMECKEFPGGDAGYADTAGRPVRGAECYPCANRW